MSANQTPSLESLANFKFWRLQRPNASELLKEIIWRWRSASAYVLGKAGKWVVWPRERWCAWTGLSRNQFDRALRELAEVGLVRRERHRFAGSEVRTFLQPTQLALKYMGKSGDVERLLPSTEKELAGVAQAASEKASKMIGEEIAAKITEHSSDKFNEKTDYTSFPSCSSEAICSSKTKETIGQLNTEGNGSAGNEYEESEKFGEALTKLRSKQREIALAKFPMRKGQHQQRVRHPVELYPNFGSFSYEVQARSYAKYILCVDNWYAAQNRKKGKSGSSNALNLAAAPNGQPEADDAEFWAAIENLKGDPQS